MKHPAINLHDSLNDNFFRIILFYNSRAIRHLQSKTSINENIHDARLCFKRIRSLLRLSRTALSYNAYTQLNAFYRNQGRKLSHARDLTALVEAIKPMIQNRKSPVVKASLVSMQKHWMLKRSQKVRSKELLDAKTTVCTDLTAIQQHLVSRLIPEIRIQYDHAGYPTHHIAGTTFDTEKESAQQFPITDNKLFIEGLIRVFRQGHKLYHACRKNPNDHDLHEWRKSVKYTWYQLVMLQPLWPGMIKAWAKEWQMLSVLLGDYHDLVLVTDATKPLGNKKNMSHGRGSLMRSTLRHKKQLLNKSLQQGKKLYAESTAGIRNKLVACVPE